MIRVERIGEATMLGGKVRLLPGDCREVMATLPDASVDAIVCDPPYGLGFMGRAWDAPDGAPFAVELWQHALRVLKPGGHLVAFSGTRTYHRMACAIEDAGFEIRDQLAWVYGSGFPKSHNVSVAIDKAAGAERVVTGIKPGGVQSMKKMAVIQGDRANMGAAAHYGMTPITAPATDAARQWQGWGTALKPSWEPICLARKPLIGTVAANVLAHGTGALNIDGCRVGMSDADADAINAKHAGMNPDSYERPIGTSLQLSVNPMPLQQAKAHSLGRWPANLLHDGSEEVVALFPDVTSGSRAPGEHQPLGFYANAIAKRPDGLEKAMPGLDGSSGSAARFFYSPKADSSDRLGSPHPTVKPVDLMQWLCRLVCPKGGVVLDPFAGTGTTGEAAWREGMRAILIEREPEYQQDIARRMDLATQPTKRAAVAATKNKLDDPNTLPLFAGAAE
jgi:DNA modification methylase